MKHEGIFKGWLPSRSFGFIRMFDGTPDVFLHVTQVIDPIETRAGYRLSFEIEENHKGRNASKVSIIQVPLTTETHRLTSQNQDDGSLIDDILISEDVEELNADGVTDILLTEISKWKLDAKIEDSSRYFWHVKEVDAISRGEKCFVIGRKGSGKTAICQHFSNIKSHDVFSEKLSVASRTIIRPFMEQMRVGGIPVLHGLHRGLALQGGLRQVVIVQGDIT